MPLVPAQPLPLDVRTPAQAAAVAQTNVDVLRPGVPRSRNDACVLASVGRDGSPGDVEALARERRRAVRVPDQWTTTALK